MEISIFEFADRVNEILPTIIKESARLQINELYKGKITLPQFLILEFLNRAGESKMTDLSRFMNVTTAAMTGIVDRLVRDGYVQRLYSPEDRRVIKIKSNAKAALLVRKINEQRRQTVIKIFGSISEQDRKDYLRILSKIQSVLTKEKA